MISRISQCLGIGLSDVSMLNKDKVDPGHDRISLMVVEDNE